MKKRIQKEAAIFILLLFVLFLFGCDKKEKNITIFGGNLIKNNTMFTSRQDGALAYELPIISSVEITDFEVEEINASGIGEYEGFCKW